MVRKLPVLIECNSWTLPQERYNAEWVTEKRVGIVLRSFREVVRGVQRMLDRATLAEFRKNVGELENRAIFEIPEILDKLLRESAGVKASDSSGAVLQTAAQRRSS
jgi:1,2-diacylglycerol 3-beta-galactosyltransferase